MMLVEVTVNPDGTFRVETTSPHYNAASFGEAVGWFAEQLLYEQERAKAESKTVELALRHVDATIAALGLGEQGGSEMTEQEKLTIRAELARRMFPDAVIEDSPTGSGVDIRVYDKPNETRTWYNFDPFRSAEDKDALVKGLAADDDLWNRFTDQLYIEWNRVRLDNDRNVKPNAIEWERFARTAPRETITLCAARAMAGRLQ